MKASHLNVQSLARQDFAGVSFFNRLFFSILSICLVSLVLSVSVYGSTGLNSPRQFSLPTPQSAVAAGDFNNDGIPDLVLGGYPLLGEIKGIVWVMLGRGNGNFDLYGSYRVGFRTGAYSAPFVQEIKIGDLNNDGNADVVVGHTSSTIQFNNSTLLSTVLLGDGKGGLQERESNEFFADNDFVIGLEIVDFTNDGLLDVVIGTSGNSLGKVFALRNLGGGNFARMGPLTVNSPLNSMVCADVNFDGFVDVVHTTRRGIVVRYGDGAFFPTAELIGDESDSAALVVADLNSDGKVDIAVTDSFGTRLRVYARRSFRFPAVPVSYTLPFNSGYMKTSDINEDGNPDLIVAGSHPERFFILYGDGRGRFPTSEIIGHGLPVSDIVFADLDSNGRKDIAASLRSESEPKKGAVFLKAPNTSRYYTDFDGDLKTDLTVYRPSESIWFTLFSGTLAVREQPFGISGDRIVPGNYDGDNKADIAVYRNGSWHSIRSSDNSVSTDQWGLAGDIPVPADYDNDGKMNLAVYRPSEGKWYIRKDNGIDSIQWGLSADVPVPADYDGDGKTDLAVFRPSDATWHILGSNGTVTELPFGLIGDIPVPGDYDGDGKSDLAVFRPSSGNWHLLNSGNDQPLIRQWGLTNDIPVPSDYDGDGKTDLAVWRPSEGVWYLLRSSNHSIRQVRWGLSGDLPLSPN